ncbi:reverse transcriptase domain-containing protein [Chitinophaga niabensis]|uniref:reverse transcriptase domain-containing protein n=1 Tax=Chitinophaga niabensis TaxID=536979 RepID=UPI0031BBB021
MKTKEDLLELLNYTKSIIYGEKSFPFTIQQLNYYCNSNNKARYTVFKVKKKSGGERIIHAPKMGLKRIQECLKMILETFDAIKPQATGFVKGKSIVDNAQIHNGYKFVFNTDLKDFFPSIDQARIWKRLQVPPFKLNEESERVILANIIAGLCCEKMEVERLDKVGKWTKVVASVLPQGAPTSPIISNIICSNLDYKLLFMAKRFGLNYSRYADDITFSGDKDVFFKHKGNFMKELNRNIKDERFNINPEKTRLQKSQYRQEVTGLIVNDHVNIPKRYIKQLRMWLYYWETYGYERMSSYFKPAYIKDKAHILKGDSPDFQSIIRGKLNYIKMVKGHDDACYNKLAERLKQLIAPDDYFSFLLDTWEKKGLNKTMEQFYS